ERSDDEVRVRVVSPPEKRAVPTRSAPYGAVDPSGPHGASRAGGVGAAGRAFDRGCFAARASAIARARGVEHVVLLARRGRARRPRGVAGAVTRAVAEAAR